MRHGSLFSGIGGFDLAAEWMGWENVFQVEWDSFCQKVLAKNFPNVKRYGDIKKFNGTEWRGLIDIITGGFPCQPFSLAGKQKGKGDDRYLWPEMLRVIREVRPPWIVGENVPGIIRMELENICLAMEGEGYEVQPFIIPSASVDAWDKRERVWIIAYNGLFRQAINEKQAMGGEQCIEVPANTPKSGIGKLSIQQRGQNKTGDADINREIEINPDTDGLNRDNAGYNSGAISQQQATKVQFDCDAISSRRKNGLYGRESERETGECSHYFKESDWWKRDWIEVASELCRSNARVPNRMDRIKSLGNSINPQVAYQIFKAIENYENVDNF